VSILKKLLPILFFLFACIYNVIGQGYKSTVYSNDFDEEWLSKLVKEKIDSVRIAHGLSQLSADSILVRAAVDQSAHLIDYPNAKHSQEDKNKNTPAKRVKSYNGHFQLVGENILKTYINEKLIASEVVDGLYYRNQTYKQTAQNIVVGWVNSPGHFANIINPEFQYTGVSATLDSLTNRISIAQVFGAMISNKSAIAQKESPNRSKPEEGESYSLPNKRNRNVRLAQQWSENLEKNIIGWFHCTPKSLKKAFRWYHFRSGLMVESEDVALFTNESAYLNKPSRINQKSLKYGAQGVLIKRKELIKTARRNEILNGNGKRKLFQKKQNYLQIDRPTLEDSKGSERILVIRKGKLCDIIAITPHPSSALYPNFPELSYPTPFVQTISEYKKTTRVDSVSLKVYYQRNQTRLEDSEIEEINDLIPLDAKVRKIKIQAFASIEGDVASNEALFLERAKRFQRTLKQEDLLTDDISLELNTQENWEVMERQIADNPKFQSLIGKSKEDIRNYFNKNSNDSVVSKALDNQRYAEVTALLAYEKWIPLKTDEILNKYDSLNSSSNKLSFTQIRKLASLQAQYYEGLISAKQEKSNALSIPNEARFSELLYKEALFNYLHRNSISETEFIRRIRTIGQTPKLSKGLQSKLIEINLIAVTKQLFTRHNLALDPSSLTCKTERANFLFLKPIKEHAHNSDESDLIQLSLDVIPELIRHQNNTPEIENLIHQAQLYYWIRKAQRIRNSGNIRQLYTINKLLNYIWNRHILKSELTEYNRIEYARFFNLFKRYEYSKELLEPLVKRENPNHQALMIWISLMVNDYPELEVEKEILNAKSILTEQEWSTMIYSGDYLSNTFLERNEIRKVLQGL
jgi:uncharacterized protein YkwD